MQVVVKTRHTEIKMEGKIPKSVLTALKAEYGTKLKISSEEEEELLNIFKTTWFKDIKKKMTPSGNLKIYRQMHGFSQAELGKKLGGIPRQHISNMENGSRPIGKEVAKKLASTFDVSVEKFI